MVAYEMVDTIYIYKVILIGSELEIFSLSTSLLLVAKSEVLGDAK